MYVALERCKTSLADLVSSPQPFIKLSTPNNDPTPEALSIASDAAQGVAALHSRGIVHRDLKPQNVLLTESCSAKLSDMGLSKQLLNN